MWCSVLPHCLSALCVCQHEPKLLFCGEESWKWGLKTQLCCEPGPGTTCWFALGHGKWEQALGCCPGMALQWHPATPGALCQSSSHGHCLAAKSSFPVGAGAVNISVLAPWPSFLTGNSPSAWQPLLC